jgi:23S rRNA pseudouridine2605 synthase
MVLREGRNREVRRIIESQDLKVSRLIRTRYGQFVLPSYLKRGQYKELETKDVEKLLKGLGIN